MNPPPYLKPKTEKKVEKGEISPKLLTYRIERRAGTQKKGTHVPTAVHKKWKHGDTKRNV